MVWHGVTYFESTDTVTYHTLNAAGCDSTVRLHLTINHSNATDEYLTICENELPYHYINGQIDTTFDIGTPEISTVHYHLSTANGCDSLVSLHLTIHPSYHIDDHLTICENELPYHYINGQIDTIFDIGTPELSAINYYLFTEKGCDSVITLHLTINMPENTATTVHACDPYLWNDQMYNSTGSYTFVHPDENGCLQTDTLHLVFLDPSIEIISRTLDFCDENSAVLEVQTELSHYEWNTGENYNAIRVYDAGTYTVTATDGECTAEASFTIAPCDYLILLPNAISPNGDGINDEFRIPEAYYNQIHDEGFNIWIYNRWGVLVFSSSNKSFQWNGEVNGQIYHDNVYNYIIEYRNSAGTPKRMVGSLIVL